MVSVRVDVFDSHVHKVPCTVPSQVVVPVIPPSPNGYASEFSVRQSVWMAFQEAVHGVRSQFGDADITFCVDAGVEVSYYFIEFCRSAKYKVMVPTFTNKRVGVLGPKGDLNVRETKTFCGFREIGGSDV